MEGTAVAQVLDQNTIQEIVDYSGTEEPASILFVFPEDYGDLSGCYGTLIVSNSPNPGSKCLNLLITATPVPCEELASTPTLVQMVINISKTGKPLLMSHTDQRDMELISPRLISQMKTDVTSRNEGMVSSGFRVHTQFIYKPSAGGGQQLGSSLANLNSYFTNPKGEHTQALTNVISDTAFTNQQVRAKAEMEYFIRLTNPNQ